jgi:hypothetical protein
VIDAETGIQPKFHIDPGNSASFNASIAYSQGSFAAQLAAVYTAYGTTKLEGIRSFQTGDNIALAAAVAYAWTEAFSTTVSGQATHTESNFTLNPELERLPREPENSNSNVYRIGLDGTYQVTTQFAIGPTVSWSIATEMAMFRQPPSSSPRSAVLRPAASFSTL